MVAQNKPSDGSVSAERAYLSDYCRWCQGAKDTNAYVMAVCAAAAKVKREFGGYRDNLDRINAFDAAEVAEMNLGQLNLIQVSSFCGPRGLVWGLDLAQAEACPAPMFTVGGHDAVPVFSAEPLIAAARALFGTVERPRYSLAPGSLVPAAYKSFCRPGPAFLYSVIGIGFPENRSTHAATVMEDMGSLNLISSLRPDRVRQNMLRGVASSVVAVMRRQGGGCVAVYVAMRGVSVGFGEIGCAFVAAPYFALARGACPFGVDSLTDLTLSEWNTMVG